jgi:hypothetical protein
VRWGDVDWIGLAQDRNRRRALVNLVLNLRVPWNAGKLSSGLSVSAQFHIVSSLERYNINMYLKETGREDMDKIHLVQSGVQWCYLLDMVKSLQVSKKARISWPVDNTKLLTKSSHKLTFISSKSEK